MLSGWAGIQGDPTILGDGKQRIIAFGGDKEGKPSNYDNDAEYYLTSTRWQVLDAEHRQPVRDSRSPTATRAPRSSMTAGR